MPVRERLPQRSSYRVAASSLHTQLCSDFGDTTRQADPAFSGDPIVPIESPGRECPFRHTAQTILLNINPPIREIERCPSISTYNLPPT